MTRTIEIIDYDPAWPDTFAGLSSALAAALGPLALRIEHVGSTSVPGLGAKPIIDIDVIIESPRLLPLVVEGLGTLGYSHEGDGGIPDREAFGRAGAMVPADGSGRVWPAHHLYVCPSGSEELQRHLRFRDYLRSHPDSAARYEALKRDLAHRHANDIDAYVAGKSAFVERILAVDGGEARG
ncbi:MAG: GrpB family protein [Dehalococcoidia bacterium]|nr:GrpB family protein [Dehalococcoidia bacterium]MYA52215.1 GrpB family protein [Dehalococcoidia bacterium]